MSQQLPISNHRANLTNTPTVRRLFVESGYGWQEIANSKGKLIQEGYVRDDKPIARIVAEYTPPSPSSKSVEIKLANAPSIVHSTGKSSYKTQLRLMFPDNVSYSNFIFYMGSSFKYYDERGGIFKCVIQEQPNVSRVEAGKRYDVKVDLIGVRKESDEFDVPVEFTDLTDDSVHIIEFSDYPSQNITVRINFTGLNKHEDIVINLSYYADYMKGFILPSTIVNELNSRGYAAYFGINYSYGKLVITPKTVANRGVTFDTLSSTLHASVTTNAGKHWAYQDIIEGAAAGIVATQDGRGNMVYTFRPEAKATRAEAVAILNNTRKWIEEMIRG